MMTVDWNKFWDDRYNEEGHIYGKEPNVFFKEIIDSEIYKGTLLLPAEGAGRNAIYAAKKGWNVDAFDFAKSAKENALKFASDEHVQINYFVTSVENFTYEENKYDLIAMIYSHLAEKERVEFFNNSFKSLKKGGKLIIEAFTPKQLNKSSGGPKDLALLYTVEDLKEQLNKFNIQSVEELQTNLDEGKYHHGEAEIIRVVAVK
jgi:2-polyprenyl-3-methyl-5-hydroxy-6-metoxy-1,4-benzoquinol methylase